MVTEQCKTGQKKKTQRRKSYMRHSLNIKLLIWALAFIVPIIGLFWIGVSLAMNSFGQQLILTNRQILKPYLSEMEVTLETIHSYVANREIPFSLLKELESDSELVRMNALQELNQDYTADIFAYPKMDAVFLKKDGIFRFIRNVNSDYSQQCDAAEYVEKYTEAIKEEDNPFQDGYQMFEADGVPYFLLTIKNEGVIWGCWICADNFLEEIDNKDIDGLEKIFLKDEKGIWKHETENEEEFFIVEQASTDGSFQIVAWLDRETVFRPFQELNGIMVVLIGFSVLLLIAYLVYLSVHLRKPIRNLAVQMNRIKKGDFSECVIPQNTDGEILEVYEAMNSMTSEISQLKIDIYEEKLRKQEANMQLLQMQIKPHFFLNALTTILGFAQAKDYEMVQKMTLCLSKHFRYILYRDNFISVEEELEHIKNYLEIQKIKRQTDFRYEIDVEEEVYEEEIPILTLQTLAENALKHSSNQKVTVKIRGKIEKGEKSEELILCVEDDGKGFEAEQLKELNRGKKISQEKKEGGIGLYNISQRLDILYHGKARMYFSNKKEGGACVEMRIPKAKGMTKQK